MGKRGRRQGHPARRSRSEKRARGTPGPREVQARELAALVREQAIMYPHEGLAASALGSAARYAAPFVVGQHPDLAGPEHEAAIACYLTERLGAVIDGFDSAAYQEWREDCRDSAALRDQQRSG